MSKYLARLKSEKQHPCEPTKPTKVPFDSYVSSDRRRFSEITMTKPPQWQQDFCKAHAGLNNWRGCCPKSIDDCLISEILDSNGQVENLKKTEICKGVTTDDVIQQWKESGEPIEDIFKEPLWFVCMAESIAKGRNDES